MFTLNNCQTYKTGIEKPHTIKINNSLVSIDYGLNAINYYVSSCAMQEYCIAYDKDNNKYTILKGKGTIIAIPEQKPVKKIPYIYQDNLYRIICRNKEKNTAYCEKIKGYRKCTEQEKKASLTNNPAWYTDMKNGVYICSFDDIITDPKIIKSCFENSCFYIELPGYKA